MRLTPGPEGAGHLLRDAAAVLLDRQLARLSGVPYSRDPRPGADRRPTGRRSLRAGDAGRDPGPGGVPHRRRSTWSAVAESADGCDADLILIDYLQRLDRPGHAPGQAGPDERRPRHVPRLRGRRPRAVGAVERRPAAADKHGKSGYDGLTLASFKESGDIEYAADDAFMLPRRRTGGRPSSTSRPGTPSWPTSPSGPTCR